MICCAGNVIGRSVAAATRTMEEEYRIVKHLRIENYMVLICVSARYLIAISPARRWTLPDVLLNSVLLRRSLSGVFPKVNRAFLCVAINLRQFCIRELELLHRIERVIELLHVTRSDEC